MKTRSSFAARGARYVALEALERRTLMSGGAVLEWNATMLDAIRADRTPPPLAARDMAMVQIAVFDAVNAISGGYEGYLVHHKAPPDASAPAAAAQAAHDVLVALFPAQAARFDAKLADSLSTISAGPSRNKGVALGHGCADQILKARSDDGSSAVVSYTIGTDPGDWQPTPAAFNPNPVLPQWPGVTPFCLASASMFRLPGPPSLDSQAYTDAYNEVKAVGPASGSTRTADQTLIARFWADGAGTATPPGHWNQIAADVALAKHNTLAQDARLFAELNIALADAGIAAWDCKYVFNLWRPVTAIRAGDTDGNPQTAADAGWSSLLTTPNFPSYLSGHSTFSAAAATVLADFYGTDDIAFTTGDDTLPGVQRSFPSFSAAAGEAGQSRIYGGIHYQFDNQDALVLGRDIGQYVVTHALLSNPAAVVPVSPNLHAAIANSGSSGVSISITDEVLLTEDSKVLHD